jgi:hypothetical protein
MPHQLHRAAAVLGGGSYDHESSQADHSLSLLCTEPVGYTLSTSYYTGPFVLHCESILCIH